MTNLYKVSQTLLKHCLASYLNMLEEGNINIPPWNVPKEQLTLYFHDSMETLSEVSKLDTSALKKMGFCESLEGNFFIPWFKKGADVLQVCPVDITQWVVNPSINGLNRELPLFIKKINYQLSKDKVPVFVTLNPIDAMILNAQGHLAVALGAEKLLKGQIKPLAELNVNLIYLLNNSKQSEQSAEHFSLLMSKYTHVDLMFIHGEVRDYIIKNEMNYSSIIDSVTFLAQRIMNKDNGKSSYERNIEIINVSRQLGELNKANFLRKSLDQGAKDYSHFSQSLRLLADLIDTKISIDKSREIVEERFGISIFMRECNNLKLE